MKWIGKRVSFIDDKQKTTIVIYPENITWVNGLMGAWVAMWFAIGAIVVWSFFTFKLNNQELIALLIFMSFWLYYALKVGRSFLWLLWGKELIKIDETALHYKKSIKNYGASTPYYLDNIGKMSITEPKEHSFQAVWEASPWITGSERIEFDYKGKTIRFGKKLISKDSKLLLNLITNRIEGHASKSK